MTEAPKYKEHEAKHKVGDKLWFTDEDGNERRSEVVDIVDFGKGEGPQYRFVAMNDWGYYYYKGEDEVSTVSLRERVERLERILGQLAEIGGVE